jgi:beta-lactamase superfamily II metal-dependent hydrolase
MSVQIEFLGVGDESKGGDAIIICIGDPDGPRNEFKIVVVDGGYKAAGEQIVESIRDWYDTDVVDLVVSTHPDQDHISGLFVVLNELDVRELWMHLPWNHSTEFAALRATAFKSDRLSDFVEKSLNEVSSLDALARSLGIPIVEPFTGTTFADGAFTVLGPDVDFYTEQLAQIPDPATTTASIASKLFGLAKSAVKFVEDLFTDNLSDNEVTSARNNTSVVSLLIDDPQDYTVLLTADAGIPALENIIPVLRKTGIDAGGLNLVQVPHHGSRHNVGPTVLDELLGAARAAGVTKNRGGAVVSAPKKNPDGKHPNKAVTNAFYRRGYPVTTTFADGGSNAFYSRPKTHRPGYSSIEPLPFYDEYEGDE